MKSTDILFETIEEQASPENPEAAYCSTCSNVKPIEDFTRKPTILEAGRWGWRGLRDKRNAMYVGKECNDCATERRKNATTKAFDYAAYNESLYATGKYEYLVQHPRDAKLFITQRERMVLMKREERRQVKVEKARKAYAKRYARVYANYLHVLRNERSRIKHQIKSPYTSDAAREFCELYLPYLVRLAEIIEHERKTKVVQPRETIQDYADQSIRLMRDTREAWVRLGGAARDRVKPKFI